MTGLNDILQWRTVSGATVTSGGVSVTPQSQALIVHTPIWSYVWNRPVAVLVERDGQTERIPIVDVTRLALIALSFSVVAAILAVRFTRRPARKPRI